MQKFDMGEAWKQCMDLLRLYWWKVAAYVVLAYVAVFAIAIVGGLAFATTTTAGFGFNDAMAIDRIAAAGFVLVFIFVLVLSVFFFASYYASWRLSLSAGQDNFAGSLLYGIIASVPAMLVTLVVFAAFGLAAVVLAIPFGFSMGGMGGMGSGAGSVLFVLLLFILYGLLALFLVARLGLCGPIMAAHKSYNPFFGFAESWKMTRGSTGMLMLYIFIVNLVLAVVFGIISGIAGAIGYGTAIESIITFPVNIAFTVIYTLIPAGMYNSIASEIGIPESEVESIFA